MIDVRVARPDDALAAAEVHVRSWQVGYRGLIAQDYLDGLRATQWAQAYRFDRTPPDGPCTLLALDGQEIHGLVTTGHARDADLAGVGEVKAMYVDPPRWGSGVGRLLMTAARTEMIREGFGEAALWVIDGNVRARRFYELDGWMLDGERRTEVVGGGSVDEVRYRRALDD